MDVFGEFVDALAETLDDHETSAQTFADRVHLSRFHFDRVVSGIAGEPPATFRRRILLERAAHRLVSTDDEVLEIALDAGYGSHEAFTRAFQRAYGQAPSLWRRDSTPFELHAPSGVHFKPPGGLRLPATRKVTGMELIQRMVGHHVWLLGEMLARAETLPDEVLGRPIELSVAGIDDEPTLRSLLARLVGQLAMWNAAVENRPYDFGAERDATVGELRTQLDTEGPRFVAQVGEANLDETFVDAICDPPEVFTYGGVIAHVLTFAAHRRTLVLGALEAAGVTDLGSGDPMRWVAEAA